MKAKPPSKSAKRYPIHQSPLFKIRGITQLETLLGLPEARLRRLMLVDNYRVFLNEHGREIQHPVGTLGALHKRIDGLLAKIEVPDYVYSQKGRSYFDNAGQHCGNVPLGKTDISKFYPSTTREMVRSMFRREFQCAGDIAELLANIICYQQKHIPTGSTLSGRIAYFAAKQMFDEIACLAREAQSTMTLYVDDIALSGQAVNTHLMLAVRDIVRRYGLKTKSSKTKTFPAGRPKTLTGAIIAGDNVLLPNVRHKMIADTRRSFETASPKDRPAIQNSLRGRLQEAALIKKSNVDRRGRQPLTGARSNIFHNVISNHSP